MHFVLGCIFETFNSYYKSDSNSIIKLLLAHSQFGTKREHSHKQHCTEAQF